MSFVTVDSIEKLDELFSKSKEKPVVIFKHSLTCPISTDASAQMSIFDGEVNLVIVQTARNISNEIEKRTNILHESPQVIVLKDEKPVYHASHYSVTADNVNKHL